MSKEVQFKHETAGRCDSMAILTIRQNGTSFSLETAGMGDSFHIANHLVAVAHSAAKRSNEIDATKEPDVPAGERCGQSAELSSQPEESSV